MRIVVDEKIAAAREAFETLGEVACVPANEIESARLKNADILIVRSVTRVDEALLAGSAVKFVGSVTAGLDHVDTTYLRRQGIAHVNAPGFNAEPVADYVLSALLYLHVKQRIDLETATVAVVGVGEVGTRVVTRLMTLGVKTVLCDPPKRLGVSLDELSGTDVITLHVPLTTQGIYPTRHLIDSKRIATLKRGATLINTSRGDVIDGQSVIAALGSGALGSAVFDVWPGEPKIDPALARSATIATPHIAGASDAARFRGTALVSAAVARFVGRKTSWRPPLRPPTRLVFGTQGSPWERGWALAQQVCDLEGMNARLIGSLDLEPDDRARAFEAFRGGAHGRAEFSEVEVNGRDYHTYGAVAVALGAKRVAE